MTLPETIAKLRALLANAGRNYDVALTSKEVADLIGHLEERESEKPKKTDEELVEAMCAAYDEVGDIMTTSTSDITAMRAALAVVRENQ